MKNLKFIVAKEDEGVRLDIFLARKLSPSISRSSIKNLIVGEKVSINSKLVKPSIRIHFNNVIRIELAQKTQSPLVAKAMPLKIIYEDDYLLVVDKPANLTVHPGAGNRDSTLVNALLGFTNKLSHIDSQRPGIVHRLDKDTSGVLVIARTDQAHLHLAGQFKERKVEKTYLAVVEGEVQFDEDKINAPIALDPRRRKCMKVDFAAKRDAITRYKVLRRSKVFSLVELYPLTGRTHQLRVHMSYIGHPILGDKKYHGRFAFNRLALHAKTIRLEHPETKQILEFNSPLPVEIVDFINNKF